MTQSARKITETDLKRLSLVSENYTENSKTIDRLEDKLASAIVIEPAATPFNLITMNSVFRGKPDQVNKNASAANNVFKLVYPRRSHISDGEISIFTPLGIELLGSRAGETIKWCGHDGKVRRMLIEEILYQPEASGDWHL